MDVELGWSEGLDPQGSGDRDVTESPTPAERVPADVRLLISLATYNEAGNLEELIAAIRRVAPTANILVIDDDSPDGTGEIAERLRRDDPRIEVLHRPGKQGLGTAVMAGMRHAIEGKYDYFLNLDADFSHPPRYIPQLVAGMERYDVMIGSRYVEGGGIAGDQFDWKRRLMSGGINWYARTTLGLTARDTSGSFRCYRVSKLAAIDFGRIYSRGYSFMEEILFRCQQVGCRIGETPIVFENRRAGVSKINPKEALKALVIMGRIGLHRLLGRERSRASGASVRR
jgi:dolichol-phosphate mannosyltransferase